VELDIVEKRVLHDVCRVVFVPEPLSAVLLQQLGDQVPRLLRDVGRARRQLTLIFDLLEHNVDVLVEEGRLTV